MRAARAGSMRHKISIQEPTRTTDAGGGFAEAWTETGTLYGSINPTSMTTTRQAEQREGSRTHYIVARYRSLPTKARLVFGSRVFRPVGIRVLDEIKHVMEIDAVEQPL